MRKGKVAILTVMAAFAAITACVKEEIHEPAAENTLAGTASTVPDVDGAFVPGVAYVLFDEKMTALIEEDFASGMLVSKSMELNQALDELGIESMERLFPFAGEYEPRTRADGLHRWYKVRYRESIPATRAGMTFGSMDGVEVFEPLRRIKIATNDSYWSKMWGLNNTSYPGYDVNCTKVWAEYTSGNPNVIVGVIDGGIELDHPDLAANCLASGHTNYVSIGSPVTAHGHGTHVAGTIGAVINNNIGVAGIAGGDASKGERGVKLLSQQVFETFTDNEGKEYSLSGDFATAIKEATDRGAVILNNSWGYVVDTDDDGKISDSELDYARRLHGYVEKSTKAAIDHFIKYAGCDNEGNQLPDSPMKGGLVIFASGNDGIPYAAPSPYEPIVAVGAISKSGKPTNFSNYGDWVDICAPGYDVISTYPPHGYASASGTSMACPHVTGVAALICSYFGGRGFTPDDLRARLIGGANESVLSIQGDRYSGPLVDAMGSFDYGFNIPPAPVDAFGVEAVGNSLVFTFTAAADAFGYAAFAAATENQLRSMNPSKPDETIASETMWLPNGPETDAGKEFTLTLKNLDFLTDYKVTVCAFSKGKKYSDVQLVKSVTTEVNHPPVISTDYQGEFIFKQFETVSIPFTVSDPEGHAVSVNFETDGIARFEKGAGNDRYNFALICQLSKPRTFSGTIVAKDTYGEKAVKDFKYTVEPNREPEQVKPFNSIQINAPKEKTVYRLSDYVTDADGETLTYSAFCLDRSVAEIDLARTGDISITALDYGYATIRVSAYDAMGAEIDGEFNVLVRDVSEKVSFMPEKTVKKELSILTGLEEEEASVSIVSQSGTVIYQKDGVFSAFKPLVVDMSKSAPGRYKVIVKTAGETVERTIIKI